MSDDPVALDRMLMALINQERRENGFEEIAQPNLQLDYASTIGLGTQDRAAIEKRILGDASQSSASRSSRLPMPIKK